MPVGHPAWIAAWLAVLGICVAIPALVYVSSLPDYRARLTSCGTLKERDKKHLVPLRTREPKRDVVLIVDPLCPTCKALHQRLHDEGVMERLNLSVLLFPLESTCNWMLDRSLHQGSCVLSKAVLCGSEHGDQARAVLEWAYDNQEELVQVGKTGDDAVRARIQARFGPELDACVASPKTKLRLNSVLQFAVANELPVSTPQLYLGDAKICDEDTDLGLRYTLAQLAPEVLP